MSQKSSFTVVIPCYNEERAMNSFLDELESFVESFQRAFADIRLDIRIVNNNSTDQSLEILSNRELPSCVHVITCLVQGYGAALKAGFESVEADFYAFADLDNTYPLHDLIVMFRLLQHRQADMILGARVHGGSEMDWVRRFGNVFYFKLTNLLFASGLSDSCSGMRIFSKKVKSEVLSLKRRDLSFSIELTAKALSKDWSVIEYPIGYRDRLGSSKLSVFLDGFRFLFVLMRVRFFG